MHHMYTYTHDTAYRGYRARHNGIPRYINFGAHFSHRSSISSLARAMDSSPFSRLLSLLKCAYPPPPSPLRPTFYSTLPYSIRSYHPTDSATRNRGTIPQTFSPRKRNSIDKTAGAPPSLLRMILTRGTKCTAVIKSDLPALPFLLSPLFSCRLTVVPFAHFDRENSEVVTPFPET